MLRSRRPVDRLEDDGRTLLLFEHQVVELSDLALMAFDAARDGIEPGLLTERLVHAFGSPPDGDPAAAVARVVEELRALGALEPPTEADPVPVPEEPS